MSPFAFSKSHLVKLVNTKGGGLIERDVAMRIAEVYVDFVQQRGKSYHGLINADNVNFGSGGSYGWLQNLLSGYSNEFCKCFQWAEGLHTKLTAIAHGSRWVAVLNRDVTRWYDPVAAGFGTVTHNFVSLELSNGPQLLPTPDFVLDPWESGRPDIFDGKSFDRSWPVRFARERISSR
jgi:hypothetical protein